MAFTGASGCGKSTVLKLLLGLYKPQAGTVTPDESYKRLFAYVLQGNHLMGGTIRSVVAFADLKEQGNEERINNALNLVCCDFVSELPQGADTVLGERGLCRYVTGRYIFKVAAVLQYDAKGYKEMLLLQRIYYDIIYLAACGVNGMQSSDEFIRELKRDEGKELRNGRNEYQRR